MNNTRYAKYDIIKYIEHDTTDRIQTIGKTKGMSSHYS